MKLMAYKAMMRNADTNSPVLLTARPEGKKSVVVTIEVEHHRGLEIMNELFNTSTEVEVDASATFVSVTIE